jgi:hypothetical protein
VRQRDVGLVWCAIGAVAMVCVAVAPAVGTAPLENARETLNHTLGQGQGLLRTTTVAINTPGNAFTVERGADVAVDDVPGGRRFRGQGFSRIRLRALLRMAPAKTSGFKVERLAVHFRSSPQPTGPTLRRVELWNGQSADFRVDTLIQGDYLTKDLTKPDVIANVWSFAPRNVSAQSVLRLEIQFPGGFEGASDPGEFVLAGVEADFPRKPAGDMILPQR